jgi:gamma-glutamylaminecyclotransferase
MNYMDQKIHMFFYGSLKKNRTRSSVLDGQSFISEATTIPEYRMVDCGSFPALVSGDKSIQGELWLVSPDCRRYLDRIEGVPHLYDLLPIKLASHPDLECFAYIFQCNTENYPDCGVCW